MTYVRAASNRIGIRQARIAVAVALAGIAGCGSPAMTDTSGTGGTPGRGGDAGHASGGSTTPTGGSPGAGGQPPGTGGLLGTGGQAAGGSTGEGGTLTGAAGSGGKGDGGADGGQGGAAAVTGAGGAGGGVALDPKLLSSCTGTNPIKCTIPVPTNTADYVVTVELGDPAAASVARVQAELYRVVVPQMSIPAGQLVQQTFAANVRAEQHDGYSAPGSQLNLLIDAPSGGPPPRLHGLGVALNQTLPTIFMAGDSTVCDWDPNLASILDPSERGWGQELSQYLTAGIAVADYADSGETASSFYSKFFPPARTAMRTGDYLFIQFGHNDQKNSSDVTNYKANLTKYITDAHAKGATPVLFTPVARKSASTGSPGFAGLDQQARDLAASQNVALVDLTNLAIAYYKTVPNLSALFATPSEGTHFSETGATQIAGLVAGALKGGTLPLRTFVK